MRRVMGSSEGLSTWSEASRPPQGRTEPDRVAGRRGQAAEAEGCHAESGKALGGAAVSDPSLRLP